MESIEGRIRDIAKDLFDNDKIDLFIGNGSATTPMGSRPLFIRELPVDGLTWDSFCSTNLAVFLPKLFEADPRSRRTGPAPKPRVGIAAKGCDLRSIITLIKENQVPRDHVVLLGIPCTGMIDSRKVENELNGDEIVGVAEAENVLTVTTQKGESKTFDREVVLQDCCLECRHPSPPGESVDFLIEGEARAPGNGGSERMADFEGKTPEERWSYFKEEMSKCIRCNACRQACPTCWCKECFADQDDLRWIGVSTEISDVMLFHLIRIFHQAGRCVDCDACYRACPMGVDLRTFTKKIVVDVEELFGYVPDFTLDTLPPLSTFSEEDSEEFITDPE